ncbi:MAG: SDR family NAD(P)-dependent oxidoreductase [Polyangia bacterium]
MTFSLNGARCLVTGASRGLGRHIARSLAGRGAVLHLLARSKEDLQSVAAELSGSTVHIHAIDITDRAAIEALVAELPPIDVLVNNAGIETISYFHEIPVPELLKILDVNLTSALVLTRLLVPGMVERKHGHIVNIASLAGKTGPPLAETYAVTKAGLIAFTQSLRASYAGTGVSASAVCPGFIRGEGMYADRAARTGGKPPALVGSSPPEEVGEAVVRTILHDEPERFVTPTPARLLAAINAVSPRLIGWLGERLQLRAMYEKQAEHHEKS